MIKHALAKVTVEYGAGYPQFGTGFLISKTPPLVLTAYHVVDSKIGKFTGYISDRKYIF